MIKSIFWILTLTLFLQKLANATEEENSSEDHSAYFIQTQTFLWPKLSVGGVYADHRVALTTSRRWATSYRSLGGEYAYHLRGAATWGPYAKVFFERRWYDDGIRRPSIYHEQEKRWERKEDINNHTANHVGAMLGFQWSLGIPELFMQAGIGWQHNDNPIDLESGMIGLDQDTESRTEAAGEIAVGYFFF